MTDPIKREDLPQAAPFAPDAPDAAAAPLARPGLGIGIARVREIGQRLGPESSGIVLMLAAIFLFTVMDACAKHLVQTQPPMQVVWARYASQTFWGFLVFAPRLRTLLKTRNYGLQALRSGLLFGATFCFFMALEALPIAEAIAVFEVAPLFITILAVLVLGEQVGPRRMMGVVAGFAGALIIIRPGAEVFSWSSLLPMGAAFFYAAYSIATRFLGPSENPLTSFLYTSLFGTVAATFIVPFYWATPSAGNGALMFGFGIIGGIGQYLMILSLSLAPASLLAPIGYAGLIFGTFWGFMIFGETPDGWTVAGALVIVGAGLYVWARERRRGA
ncbi:DMT family transporter [Rhodovulum sp. DZ06]|uniref:DMT family transporter n=1 Tax=Rhodovulum sp. DZ06 TaxID=3425126 RepID=UPI003D353240